MHADQKTCECDERLLRGYLDRELNAADEAVLEAHLDDCPDCRRRLVDSAVEPQWWTEANRFLNRDDLDEGIAVSSAGPLAATRSLAGDSARISSHVVIRQIREWLDPSDDPRYMGRFGGYEILGLIGHGGMGVVLKGFEASLNRYVAIKVLSPTLASNGAARQRFAREARAAAAVLHENVIAIHRVDESHDLPYLVMPYIGGVSLQKRIDDDGPLPLTAVLRVGRQIAAGLAAAHAQGLVHRDIKPANTLLERGVERVTITDFGLARAADDGSLTKTGVIAGTPQYMSPEQARGEALDARSDLFSLGSVLYAMCTGRAPFRAETSYGVLRRITDEEPRPIRELNPEIPEWMCRIIARLMAKRPDDRFASASDIADLLEGCLAHVQQPTAVPLPEPIRNVEPSPRPRRHRWSIGRWLAGAAVGLIVLLAGIVVVLELNKGTLTIESDADDVSLRITHGDTVVEKLTVTRAGKKLRVAAGTYIVEIEGEADGLTIENDTVTLQRGGTEVVRLVQRSAADPELLEFPVHRSGDGNNRHVVSPPTPMEVIRELERREKLEKGSLADLYESNAEDFRIIVETDYDKVDPPRHLPGIGPARLHRVRFKCTVFYTVANEPIRKVFKIDADHLDVVQTEDEAQDAQSRDLSHRVPFEVGATWFEGGDRITIEEVRGTADFMKVGNLYEIRGTYRLASRGKATLSASITTEGTNAALRDLFGDFAGGNPAGWQGGFSPRLTRERGVMKPMTVERGEGRFRLLLHMGHEGKPHVSFYPEGGGEGFGHVYFGTGDSVLKKGWWEAAGDEPSDTTAGDVSPQIERILEDWWRESRKIDALQGQLARIVYDHAFQVSTHSTGQFYFKSPDNGRIDLNPVTSNVQPGDPDPRKTGPNGEQYTLQLGQQERWIWDGQRVIRIDDTRQEVEIFPIPDESRGKTIIAGPLPFVFGLEPDVAKRRFEFELKGEGDDIVHLHIRPRLSQDAQNWSEAEVMLLRRKYYLPYAVRLVALLGNQETVYQFKPDTLRSGPPRGLQPLPWKDKDPFNPDIPDTYKVTQPQARQPFGADSAADSDPQATDDAEDRKTRLRESFVTRFPQTAARDIRRKNPESSLSQHVDISPDQEFAVTVENIDGAYVCSIWQFDSGRLMGQTTRQGWEAATVRFAASGNVVGVRKVWADQIDVFEVPTGRLLETLPESKSRSWQAILDEYGTAGQPEGGSSSPDAGVQPRLPTAAAGDDSAATGPSAELLAVQQRRWVEISDALRSGNASIGEAIQAANDLHEAQLRSASTQAERQAALSSHVERLKDIKTLAESLGRAGIATAGQVLAAQAALLQAEQETGPSSSAEPPAGPGRASTVVPAAPPGESLPPQVWLGLGLHGDGREVTIAQVHPETGAENAGLREGDQILALDGRTVSKLAEVVDRTQGGHPGEEVNVLIRRGDELLTVKVRLTEVKASSSPAAPPGNGSSPTGAESDKAEGAALVIPPKDPEHRDPVRQAIERLAGVWRLESWTYNGKERDVDRTGRLRFRGNRVQIALISPGSDDALQNREFRYFSVNPTQSPAEINLYDTNFLVQGIYKLEGDKLTLAMYGRPEIGRPRSFAAADAQPDGETTGKLVVMTFRRSDGSESEQAPTVEGETDPPQASEDDNAARGQGEETETGRAEQDTPVEPDATAMEAALKVYRIDWGEAAGGLQAGIGFLGSDRARYGPGETVPLVVILRNVSGQPIDLKFPSTRLRYVPPRVRREMEVLMPPIPWGYPSWSTQRLAAGEETTFDVVQLVLARDKPGTGTTPYVVPSPGEYTIRYTVPLNKPANLQFGGLRTGELRFVVVVEAGSGRGDEVEGDPVAVIQHSLRRSPQYTPSLPT